MERKYLQAGVMVLVLAIFLRLISTGAMAAFVRKPVVLSAVLFLETGRWLGTNPVKGEVVPQKESPIPEKAETPPEQETKIAFQSSDATLVEVNNVSGYSVDVAAMLEIPLSIQLKQDKPTVLILHSHGSESYQNTENYQEISDHRTLDTDYNMVSVGERLAQQLEAAGIHVVHDKTLHDQPSYNESYVEARKSIQSYLAEYPSIQLVLDLHRDSVEDQSGNQKGYTVTVEGQKVARLMMVVGTDAGGRNHPNWQENFALAIKLHVQLCKKTPGICRSISFRTQRFNQDLSAGGLIIEVGAAGNTRQEALLGADALAEGIIALANGTAGNVY